MSPPETGYDHRVTADALRAVEDRDLAKLEALARREPEALRGVHARMLDADLVQPAIAFRTADSAARDRLIARIHEFDGLVPDRRSGETLALNHLLIALAWVGDAEVQRVFARWRDSPPSWASALYLPAHAYTTTAGWTLDPDGLRRNLYLSAGRTLLRAEHASGPVHVLGLGDERCHFCSNPLGALLQLDLTAPDLAFIPARGTLSIPFCHLCSVYGTILFRIDPNGRATWHEKTERFPIYDDSFHVWNEGRFALGRVLANPFEYAGWADDDVGHLGGYPGWIQDDTYPDCPDCTRPMTFVGQLEVSSGGRFYGLVCFDCMTATTVYQQT